MPDRAEAGQSHPSQQVDQRRPEQQQNSPVTSTAPAAPSPDDGATFVPSPEARPATADASPPPEAVADQAWTPDNVVASRPADDPATPTQRDDPAYDQSGRPWTQEAE